MLRDGKPAGELANEGYGGPDLVHIEDGEADTLFSRLKDIARPVCTFEPESLVIDALLRVYEEGRKAQRRKKGAR